MTDTRKPKQHKLAHEILGLIAVSGFFAALLLLILAWTGGALVEAYCYRKEIVMTQWEQLDADRWIWGLSGSLCAVGFSLLFLALLSDRMAYIRTITRRIDALRRGQTEGPLPLEGRNELTQLAAAINEMSEAQQQLRQKEQALAQQKEAFIRTLSHDIRTPLTSILAYSELLEGENSIPREDQKMYLQMLRKKAEQIRDLTALLLDGDKRSPEYFDDAHLLMEQLAAEFEEELEERFNIHSDLSGCPSFAGTFDVQELRRIFDNLSSNVQKYADPAHPVYLAIRVSEAGLQLQQTNRVLAQSGQGESYRLGLNSIRRICQNYGGRVSVQQDTESFSITVMLSEY